MLLSNFVDCKGMSPIQKYPKLLIAVALVLAVLGVPLLVWWASKSVLTPSPVVQTARSKTSMEERAAAHPQRNDTETERPSQMVENPEPEASSAPAPIVENPPAPSSPAARNPDVSGTERAELFRKVRQESEVYQHAPYIKPTELSLQDVLVMALSNNASIRITRIDPLIRQKETEAAWAEFFPSWRIGGKRVESSTAQNARDLASTGGTPANLGGGDPRIFATRQWEIETAIEGVLPTGTEYSLSLRNLENEDTTSRTSTLSLYTPEYTTFAGINIKQPLLKGFGFDANLRQVRINLINQDQAEAELQQAVADNLLGVLEQYYEFVGAWEEYQLREKAVRLTERLRESQMDQVERGLVSVAEVSRIELELSENREEAFESRSRVTTSKLGLLALILREFNAVQPVDFVPQGELSRETVRYSPETLVRAAMTMRPDYQRAMLAVKRENVELKYYANQSLPSLDVVGSYGVNGLDAGVDSSYMEAFRDYQGNQYSLGVTFKIPLGPNPNVIKRDASNLRKEQALLNVKKVETEMNLQIHLALERLGVALDRLESARKMVRHSEEIVQAMEDQLERGVVGMVDVARAYVTFVDTRSEEIKALRALRVAEANVWYASGLIYEQTNVFVEQK